MPDPLTTISHDPFARFSVIRRRVLEKSCAWCGQLAKWQYGTERDGLYTRPEWDRRFFCSKDCRDEYNG